MKSLTGGAFAQLHTLAGNGAADYTGDGGPAKAAALSSPEGVAVDSYGGVYIADTGDNRVRLVSAPAVHVAP